MKVKNFLIAIWVTLFLLLTVAVSLKKDIWLIFLYWNEPFLARNIYLSVSSFFGIAEETYFKAWVVVWLSIKFGLLFFALNEVVNHIKDNKILLKIVLHVFFCVVMIFIGSLFYIIKIKDCCMYYVH